MFNTLFSFLLCILNCSQRWLFLTSVLEFATAPIVHLVSLSLSRTLFLRTQVYAVLFSISVQLRLSLLLAQEICSFKRRSSIRAYSNIGITQKLFLRGPGLSTVGKLYYNASWLGVLFLNLTNYGFTQLYKTLTSSVLLNPG